MSDELLTGQLIDIMYNDDGPNTEERALALGVIIRACEDIMVAHGRDDLHNPDSLGSEALDWVRACERVPGGFGFYAGQLGRKPEALRKILLDWVERGCKPLDAEN